MACPQILARSMIMNKLLNSASEVSESCVIFYAEFNPLKMNRRLLYLKTQFVPRSRHFQVGYENQFIMLVDPSRCLISDKYKTHKYCVNRA
jgi:hypothetical protein